MGFHIIEEHERLVQKFFDYVEAHGDTFSIERRNKMAQIKQKIGDVS